MSQPVGTIELRDALKRPELLAGPEVILPRLGWKGRVTVLGSSPKDGKSTLLGQAVAAKVRGTDFLGEPLQKGTVVWLALDEPLADVVLRLDGYGAADGVTFFTQRPQIDELEATITERAAALLVVDTLSELVGGIVEDSNSSTHWQPILSDLRALATRTQCAIVLLDHTGKSNPNSLLGSTQKAAGVDVILTMSPDKDRANVRNFQVRGRVACSPFSLVWDGERNALGSGELSLESRIILAVTTSPGLSSSGVRERVRGNAKAIDQALARLVAGGRIVDSLSRTASGLIAGHSYSMQTEEGRTGFGLAQDRVPPVTENRTGQARTGVGQGNGQRTLSPTLKSGGETGSKEDSQAYEVFERVSIEEEMALLGAT